MLWNWNWHSTVSELKSHGALALTFCNQSATGNCMHLKFLLVCPHHPIKVSLPRSRATDKLILSKLAATSSPRLCVHLKCTNCTAAQKGEVAALSCYPPRIRPRSHRFLFVPSIRLEMHSARSRFHIQMEHRVNHWYLFVSSAMKEIIYRHRSADQWPTMLWFRSSPKISMCLFPFIL